MKLFKLHIHEKNSNQDLILNPKEHPDAKIGDIVEIYHPEDEHFRLLLQISGFNEELKGRETISVESNIASAFNLRNYRDVIMRTVSADSVALDSVEITFKDQYMGRSEMWRLKEHLLNSCVYLNKKIEFCKGDIRCQVYEMWAKGDRVACGVITSNTKVVFRSSTSMVYLFLQMSSEMWDFDIHGDLYFEKAVNGFLLDLFQRWKKLGCNHEVTIVLFSRTFYAAKSLGEFPPEMRDCLQLDYKGRYYEDFYRVAIQNERCDDWSSVLGQLRKLFTSYQDTVLKYHERSGGAEIPIPKATNSTAAQGNFLEVLNISLNVFEKHYLDRTFDRTGQLSVVVTPGVGVFEVDRELTNVTKQRIIDAGVGSDLVCVGEQPLHAVPLLKFHHKDVILSGGDDYSMPHWINLSFYSTNKKLAYSKFIPRIKLPPLIHPQAPLSDDEKENHRLRFVSDNQQTEIIHNCLFDYDAYDSKIFQIAQPVTTLQRSPRTKKVSIPSLDGTTVGSLNMAYSNGNEFLVSSTPPTQRPVFRRKLSDPDLMVNGGPSGGVGGVGGPGTITGPGSPASNYSGSLRSDHKFGRRSVASNGSPFPTSSRPGRALINPFDPSHVTIKLTSNRRRWTHIFPKGPTGVLIQQHHYQAVNGSSPSNKSLEGTPPSADSVANAEAMDKLANMEGVVDKLISDESRRQSMTGPVTPVTAPSKCLTLLWGATGEQEWTPALTTGVDWKSLTVPACLPITTDYFPDKRALNNDYVVSDYTLLPDDVNADYASNRAVYQKPLTTAEVFKELISQRLAQGFQLIIPPASSTAEREQVVENGGFSTPIRNGSIPSSPSTSVLKAMSPKPTEEVIEHKLSIGRIFHKISLTGSTITVTRYRPRHPYSPINVGYRYRFHAPNHDTYEVSGVNFTTEKLENFPWNYMDHYICTRGDFELSLTENLKYWRYRTYLLPKENPAMKKILEGKSALCDIYTEVPPSESWKQQIEDFLRFVERDLNKFKGKKPKGSPIQQQQSHLTQRRNSTSIISRPPPNQDLGNSPFRFRERVGSNRLPQRPRVTKVLPSRTDGNFLALTNEANLDDPGDVLATEIKFPPDAPLTELCEAMKHPVTGLGFLGPNTTSIPSCTFVAHDAIQWLQNRIEGGACDPMAILEKMRAEDLIRHASGDKSKRVIEGFMMYYMVQQNKDAKDCVKPLYDLHAFENEWMEVEVQPPVQELFNSSGVPRFLREDVAVPKLDNLSLYKQIYLEVDTNQKSDRVEWGHLRYHRVFQPGHAFEMVIQWVTASGPIVFELFQGWKRKAQQSRFDFFSIPADPVAEPFTEKSDPLRGPIFVPLNVECLLRQRPGGAALFDEFPKESRKQRLFLFQEEILARFGFMPCVTETAIGSDQRSLDALYVHCSGLMFILVPSIMDGLRCRKHLLSESSAAALANEQPVATKQSVFAQRYLKAEGITPGMDASFITRHVSGKNKEDCDNVWATGFLWSWNHMIANKKWKSLVINNSVEGELFQLRMLRDFKAFCANHNERLTGFWEQCWRQKEEE